MLTKRDNAIKSFINMFEVSQKKKLAKNEYNLIKMYAKIFF